MLITSRSHKMLCMILNSQEPIRIKDIARELQVSERTVKYDLESVRSWLNSHQIELHSKPNKGIWIGGEPATRHNLQRILEKSGETNVFLQPQERVKYLMLELLLQDRFIKMDELAVNLNVSRNTLVSDLSVAESLLKDWNVNVERSRLGIRLAATEIFRRAALENTVQEMLTGSEMFDIVRAIIQGSDIPLQVRRVMKKFRLSRYDLKSIFQVVKSIAEQSEKEARIDFTDRMVIGIFIRLCIVVQRLRLHQEIVYKKDEFLEIKESDLFGIFKENLARLSVLLDLQVTDHETCFICRHTMRGFTSLTQLGQRDFYTLTLELIAQVSVQMKVAFAEDALLIKHLLAHMTEKLSKYQCGVADPNPLISDIIRSYPDIFKIVKKACHDVFGERKIHFADPDIGYIVLHFLASIRRKEEVKKCRALVVCGTGRGTAQFLQTILEQEIRHLKVIGCCSAIGLESQIQSQRPDLVISVVDVEASIPVVVVNSIPTKQDFTFIEETITELRSNHHLQPAVDQNFMNLPAMERFTQEVICKGFDLSRTIRSEMREYLSDQRAEGLALHLMLMVNRMAFGALYDGTGANHEWKTEPMATIRAKLIRILQEKKLDVPESEINAILCYFV
ncbi:BglG family transcription antiterminator [Paenactinomyces guangxiensis]|uniref:PRD domain-containing protein n=1 Tax=Paenactinomyces guangxiensis TaxID=1490290 RepID=A0A7W1WQ72_9BACL|nr:PRD domain-containing protein [Paenactinomyces guangxiensis]MBA4493904.1 PRD domain-containing protein [Paenactinomyces guangxiensis]MBH8591370.1 PRD domain-containing protein [Paenactinomyces guangxiensis]